MNIADFLRAEAWRNDSAGPRYVQLRRRIEAGIDTGVLAPDAPLPPEREMAALTGLSRVTVRKAIKELVAKGTVVQRQGSGSFVTGAAVKLEQSLSYLTSFTEDMARRGFWSDSTWLERGVFMPSPREQVALALAADASVSRVVRLRMADGKPMALERASLPVEILPEPELVRGSLYEVLDRTGNRPVRAHQKISAVTVGETNAKLLGLPLGAAGLKIERNSYNQAGRVVEFTRTLYRGDAYDFVAELRLGPA